MSILTYFRRGAACCMGLMLVATTFAQNDSTQERTFHVSKTILQKALQDLHGNAGGKLPVLDGFVAATDELEKYQRGFYQYSLTMVPLNENETKLRVSVKITAWYKGESAALSGYRVLESNGRLESDLLDNLDDVLKDENVGARAGSSQNSVASGSSHTAVPDTPSSVQPKPSVFENVTKAVAVPSSAPSDRSGSKDAAAERRIQQLTAEGNSLREVLRNQSHPSNLAVIKKAKTPLFDKPIEGSDTVLVADAEDEFQIVDTTGDWVHVQVSGLSRGWVRREEVDLPAATSASVSDLDHDPRNFERAPTFQQTREEVSVFPGKWEPLDGKKVKIIWVQPQDKKSFGTEPKLNLVKTVFRKTFTDIAATTPPVAGVVVILDSDDGGMAATTMAALQQWHAGHLPDGAFWKRCLLDPADTFKAAE